MKPLDVLVVAAMLFLLSIMLLRVNGAPGAWLAALVPGS
jgi:hypothetical protein